MLSQKLRLLPPYTISDTVSANHGGTNSLPNRMTNRFGGDHLAHDKLYLWIIVFGGKSSRAQKN